MDANQIRSSFRRKMNEALETDLVSMNKRLAELAKTWGGKVYIVGGAVRDKLMGKEPKDIDYLITKIELPALAKALQDNFPEGKINEVGKSFGIIKMSIGTDEFDFAIPRSDVDRDNVTTDPNLPVEEDLSRRDFVINGMAEDVETGEIVSPKGEDGPENIKNRIIKAIGDPNKRFEEDPLRMLRALQFAARLGFDIEEKTMEAIKINKDDFKKLSSERFREEFVKGWTKGRKDTQKFFVLLRDTGVGALLFGDDFKPVPINTSNLDETQGFDYQYIAAFFFGGDYKALTAKVEDHELVEAARWLRDAVDHGIEESKLKIISRGAKNIPKVLNAMKMMKFSGFSYLNSIEDLVSKPLMPRVHKDKVVPWELPLFGGEIIQIGNGKIKGKLVSDITIKLIKEYQDGKIPFDIKNDEGNRKAAEARIVELISSDRELKEGMKLDIFDARLDKILYK